MQRVDANGHEQPVVGEKNEQLSHRGPSSSAVILLLALLALLPAAAGRSFAHYVVVYGLATSIWLFVVGRAPSVRPGPLIALLLGARIVFLLTAPALSGDVYRYLWDGSVLRAGISPYLYAPSAVELEPLRSSGWYESINHPAIRTIYPPLAQLLFGGAAHGLAVWRALLLLCDAATALLLHRLRPAAALAFALCPLVVTEGVWNGHLEAVVTPLVLAATLAVSRPRLSGAAAALAAGLKIAPLIAVPALLRSTTKRVQFLLIFTLLLAVPVVPFARGTLMPGMTEYAARWSFNSPVYTVVRGLVSTSGLAVRAKDAFTSVKDDLELEPLAPVIYRQLNVEPVTRAVLALMLIAAVAWIVALPGGPLAAVAASYGALLVLSPTIHPWYWLPLLPILLLRLKEGSNTGAAWLLIAVSSPASYLLYQSVSPVLVAAVCYLPGALASVQSFRRLRPPTRKEGRSPMTGEQSDSVTH